MDIHLTEEVRKALSEKTGTALEIKSHQPVYGGAINETECLETTAGKFFIKINSAERPDMFLREAEGLLALEGAVKDSLTIPKPVVNGQYGDHIFLVLSWLETTEPQKGFPEKLGRGMALLHRHSNDRFGWKTSNYLGRRLQVNTPTDSWAEFYAQQRILPFVRQAYDKQLLLQKDVKAAENLCNRFSDIFPIEKPALLHGDFWNGNYCCVQNSQAAIYDPAVYYGNREMDIAMSLLFGGFDPGFYNAYQEAFPLQENWQERIRLCQLYPLLMHLLSFGSGYYASVREILRNY